MAKIVDKVEFLSIKRLASGRFGYYWQPSATLKKKGWKPFALGTALSDRDPALIAAAKKQNEKIGDWRGGGEKPREVKAFIRRATMAALIDRYREEELPTKRATTQHEYKSSLKVIEQWAGAFPVAAITRQRVQVLKKALIAPPSLGDHAERNGTALRAAGLDPDRPRLWLCHRLGPANAIAILTADPLARLADAAPAAVPAKPEDWPLPNWPDRRAYEVASWADRQSRPKLHRAAGVLRMLRTLMQFAVDNDELAANPVERAGIPTPPPRQQIVSPDALAAIAAKAAELGYPTIALGVALGFSFMQRQSDILKLTHRHWRELHGIPPEARPMLAGADGRVMGFRLRQKKTNEWVEVPIVGEVREAVEAAIAAARAGAGNVTNLSTPILTDPDSEGGAGPWPQWKLQRRFREVVNAAREDAAASGDIELVEDLTDVEYRDLRRTGMVFYGELGVPDHFIASISGHSLERTKKILETYMPRNSRMAASAVAMALTALGQRAAAQQQEERA